MRALIIGSGGREHAVIKSLSKSSHVTKIFACPGNAGTTTLADTVVLDLKNHQSVVQFCQIQKMGFVFIGPEDSLFDGLADSLREANILVVGPSKHAARLEGSKIFAKEFMQKASVPTAEAIVVDSVASTLEAAKKHSAPYVLKADGLAAGKGVFICKSLADLEAAAKKIFVDKVLGTAGEKALLERNLNGSVATDNNAPDGRYSVVVQFVVDVEGNVSDIKTLTNHGYGLEAEALRVLRKAAKWEPAIQNGKKVKAYRKQVIVFEVTGE